MSAAVAATGLTVGYVVSGRRIPILTHVAASLRGGEFTALVGPNGAGKTTLLRSLAGLQAPLAGTIEIGGRPLAAHPRRELARRLATVLTDRIGVDHLRVRDLVALGRHPHLGPSRTLRAPDKIIIDDALATVDAAGLADRLFSSLSDGQRQRVLIARALAQQPEVLILDEPTSFLDPAGRISIMLLLRRLARQRGTAVLASTHEVELALRHCDRLWVAAQGDLTAGTPSELAHDGTIARAFATPGVRFSARRMGFVERDLDPGDEGAA